MSDDPRTPDRGSSSHSAGFQEIESGFLKTLLANTPDFVYFKDRERRYLKVSKPFEDLFGLGEAEIRGRRDEDLFPPEVAAEGMRDDRRVIEDGIPLVNKVEGTDTPDGGKLWVLTTKIPWRDGDGNIRGLFGISRDITERIQAEEALLAETEFTRASLDALPDTFFVFDPGTGKVLRWNRIFREASGYSDEEIARLPAPDSFYRSGDLKRVRAFLDEVKERGFGVIELDLMCKDGRTIPTEYKVAILNGKDGEPQYVISIGRDVTERKRAEEQRLSLERQVQHAQKLESLGVLAGGIAHDFNNILVSILGHAELLKEALPPGARSGNHVEEIVVGAQRAAELAHQMLAYSGKGRIESKKINLNEFVEEMTHLLEVSTSKKADLNFDFASELPPIECDITQVGQVVMNLITNASEAIGDATGVISVTTGKTAGGHDGDFVYLEVTDTGCGMDEETRQRMFEPFFTTKFTGRGLGMAAVQGIVHGHGGAIEVHSAPGAGTRVRVLFPALCGASESIASRPLHEVPSDAWTGSGTALVVDDEESVRTLTKKVLETVGFQVLTAADGHEAIEVFREHMDAINLVILDLTMPQMDGEECHRALVELRDDVRVILASGYSEQEISRRFAGGGIRGFIQKPYRLATMKAKVRAALQD